MKTLLFYIVLVSLQLAAFSQNEQKYLRKGNKEYDKGEFKEAEINYLKALDKNPESVKADFNLGNSVYRQENYGSAAEHYAGLVDKAENSAEAAKYYYNLGNSLFKDQKYKESVEAFRNALLNDPGDMDAKHNLQMALRMLGRQQQQQQQQDQQQQDQQQQQQQQQNQQNQQNQKDQQNQQQADQQQQSSGDKNQEGQPQQVPGQISKEDAERILQALENDEKEVLKRVQDQKTQRREVPVDKNW